MFTTWKVIGWDAGSEFPVWGAEGTEYAHLDGALDAAAEAPGTFDVFNEAGYIVARCHPDGGIDRHPTPIMVPGGYGPMDADDAETAAA